MRATVIQKLSIDVRNIRPRRSVRTRAMHVSLRRNSDTHDHSIQFEQAGI